MNIKKYSNHCFGFYSSGGRWGGDGGGKGGWGGVVCSSFTLISLHFHMQHFIFYIIACTIFMPGPGVHGYVILLKMAQWSSQVNSTTNRLLKPGLCYLALGL